MRRYLSSRLPLVALSLGILAQGALGCGDGTGEGDTVVAYVPPPDSALVEDGAVKIRREVFLVAGVVPPPNPLDGAETPPEQNVVRVVRYRVDADSPLKARSIAVLMPGFLGGAGSYDSMARAIVRRSSADDALEAWAIDRRSNMLEDHHALDFAEVMKRPEVITPYYFEEEPLEGKTFAGFVDPATVPYMSEWGLATTIGDLRNVMALVPQTERKARVILVGHSLGASIVEEFAAWDFDGTPGYEEIAGLVLIDGMSGVEGDSDPPITKEEYEQGTSFGGFPAPGLTAVRESNRYTTLPFIGLDVYPTAAALAMRGVFAPTAIVEDYKRNQLFGTLLSLASVPKMTNRGALGLAFDEASNGVSFAAVSCGEAKGGPMAAYDSILGSTLVHPSDPNATYDWVEYDAVSPPEHTSIDDIARSWFEGPSLDFAEWYFPSRLSLDTRAAGTLVLDQQDYPLAEQDLRAIHGASMDMPILGAVAGLVGTTAALNPLRALVASVPIGAGRPLAGRDRSDADAFRVVDITVMTHIDPLSGTDAQGSLSQSFYDELVAWMLVQSSAGGTSVPIQVP